MIALIAAGYGLGFSSMPRISELNNPDIATRPLADQSKLTTYLVRRDSEASAVLDRFIDRVKRIAPDPGEPFANQPAASCTLDACCDHVANARDAAAPQGRGSG